MAREIISALAPSPFKSTTDPTSMKEPSPATRIELNRAVASFSRMVTGLVIKEPTGFKEI